MPTRALSDEVGQLIGRARRLLTAGVRRRLASYGQSLHDWQVVNALMTRGPLSQIELAEHTGQHPAGLSRLLTSLERARLVTRKVDARDRRRVVVALAPRGRRWFARWRPEVYGAIAEEMKPLSSTELRRLRGLLAKWLRAER